MTDATCGYISNGVGFDAHGSASHRSFGQIFGGFNACASRSTEHLANLYRDTGSNGSHLMQTLHFSRVVSTVVTTLVK